MITVKDNFSKLTPEEYFVWEEKQLEKHEYLNGEIYEMSAKNVNEARLGMRLTTLFFKHLEGSNCETGNSAFRVKIAETNNYTHPDVSVTCNERDKTSTQFISYPCLIVEVLSKSTEAYDRGRKFRLYQKNPILQDYLLVSSTSIEMDLYHKNDAGEWFIMNYQVGDIVELKSINLSFPIEQIYRDLTLIAE